MEDIVGVIGRWGCGFLAVVALGWGTIVLVTGRAPQREVRQYRSVARYGWFCVGIGIALGLMAIGTFGGWFNLSTLLGFVMLLGLNIVSYRERRRRLRQRRTHSARLPG